MQHALSSVRDSLRSEGVLYPEFRYKERTFHNHSIPLYSMFAEDPASYHMNQRMGLQTPEEIREVNESYRDQLLEQVKSFCGNRLLFSGEDLSFLNDEELKDLKTFFTEQFGPSATFTILLYIRNPIRYANSMVQEKLKHGSSLNSAIDEQIEFSGGGGFRKIFERFETCFSRNRIWVIRFEDALKDEFGVTGAFFKAAGLNPSLADQIPKEKMNPSMSIEAGTLLAAIRSGPNQINRLAESVPDSNNRVGESESETNKLNLQRLIELPGQKFSLSTDFHQTIWENSLNDMEWICNIYSLQHYRWVEPKQAEPQSLWSRKAIHYLFRWVHRQPISIRKQILQALDADIQKK